MDNQSLINAPFLGNWVNPGGVRRAIAISILTTLIASSALWVHQTGGMKYVYSHSMYVPILLAGLIFQIKGGLIAAVAGGLVLGPIMPLDVATGERQAALNWLSQMGFFALIGTLSGLSVRLQIKQIEKINWLAYHNPSTRLPNRTYLEVSLRRRLKRGHAARDFFLLVISCDNVLDITNTLGQAAAEDIVGQIYRRLHNVVPGASLLFHYHPERLAILLPAAELPDVTPYISVIAETLEQSCQYGGIPIYVNTSIGCVPVTGDVQDEQDMIMKADIAMSQARRKGVRHVVYDGSADHTDRDNLALLGSLRSAIEKNQLYLEYQPKIDVKSRRTIGVEALIRWRHPVNGLIPPGRFIPPAEQTELINALTLWVLDAGLQRLRTWHEAGMHPSLAVNVSTRNLQHSGFLEGVFELLDKHHIDATCLELEVTESDIMRDPEAAISLLKRLTATQITISIDDFGTGYSSLAYLNRLPATAIKIDQSFIRELAQNDGAREIVNGSIALAHSLGLKVVAEGIEDEASLDVLSQMGCDIGQGYFISKPLPVAALDAWFRDAPFALGDRRATG